MAVIFKGKVSLFVIIHNPLFLIKILDKVIKISYTVPKLDIPN